MNSSRKSVTIKIAKPSNWSKRRGFVMLGFLVMASSLVGRTAFLQLYNHDFYVDEGNARQLRAELIPANRGDLLDRSGDPLAISTPITSLWGVPEDLAKDPAGLRNVALLLQIDPDRLQRRVDSAVKAGRAFIYIKRHVVPELVAQVLVLGGESVKEQTEYRRYYPSGSAAAHLVGFTGIDDQGREGLEMAYEDYLAGESGMRRVITDLYNNEITGLDIIKPAIPGRDLRLSIDRQLQYFANRALEKAVVDSQAESGSVVVMDIRTGEIMAMVNYPTYNPNDVSDRSGGRLRNRAVTDVFEPGSTMKPFTIAAALDSGKFKSDDIVYTSPGHYTIGKYEITDDGKDHGWLDLSGIVTKSSNVGISKIARELDEEQMWSVFDSFGFGNPPGTEFPGEVAGFFNHSTSWNHTEQATISYGYGISVSALQLVRAYATLANDGVMRPVSYLALDETPAGTRVVEASIAQEVQLMLESVVSKGTGKRAQIPGYRVAGKTGTSHRSQEGGYAENRYIAVFAGFAPVSDPRLAVVVVVKDPKAGQHFGGVVAAPVFADVMSQGLRLGGIEPDAIDGRSAAVTVVTPKIVGDNS
ncbi:MAG: cell division protein FtsI (penicillin-binding protein 3) [Gammaproteobacteria bacterium]|jgi:cell division protein FtsI (penicillin-binding protein 3)